jgi:hypothetical protein
MGSLPAIALIGDTAAVTVSEDKDGKPVVQLWMHRRGDRGESG